MKDIKKPEFMKAAMTAPSHNLFFEMLIALLVFFTSEVLVGILQVPVYMVYLLTNKEYMSMIFSNTVDFEKIMRITMNMPDWLTAISLLLEAGLIVVFILYCRIFEKRKAATLGFRKKGFIAEYGKGIAIGALMFLAVYGISIITGSMRFSMTSSDNYSILYLIMFFFGYLVQGMAEEVICRGYLMVSLSRRYSVVSSIIISSAFFAMLHGLNAGVGFLAFLNLFLFGSFMGLLFVRCENIWVVGAVHSIWNFVQGNILGIQVSGLKQQASLFTTELIEGRELMNGGGFGAEGGLAVTLVLGISIAVVLRSMQRKELFVQAEPVYNPYDHQQNIQPPYPGQGYGSQGYGNQNQNQMSYQNYQENVNGNSNPYSGNEEVQKEGYDPVGQNMGQESAGKTYENMGANPQETPWHPQQENPEEKKMTEFDQNYFKE